LVTILLSVWAVLAVYMQNLDHFCTVWLYFALSGLVSFSFHLVGYFAYLCSLVSSSLLALSW